ncbi:hypothetical protein STEG23_029435, partial [Scotinomys teguina]
MIAIAPEKYSQALNTFVLLKCEKSYTTTQCIFIFENTMVSCLCSFIISEVHTRICLLEKFVHPLSSSLCGFPAVLYLILDDM